MSNLKKQSEEKTDNRNKIGVDKDDSQEQVSDQTKNSETNEEQRAADSAKSSDNQTPGNTRPVGIDA